MTDFLVGVGLVFVIEGLMFAMVPGFVRARMMDALTLGEGTMRAVGLASAVFGVTVVWIARWALA